MTYEVILRPVARKQLDSISDQDFQRIVKVINGLEHNPRPDKVKKLANSGYWRVRTGNFRVVYSIDDANYQIIIVRIARRNEETHKNLV